MSSFTTFLETQVTFLMPYEKVSMLRWNSITQKNIDRCSLKANCKWFTDFGLLQMEPQLHRQHIKSRRSTEEGKAYFTKEALKLFRLILWGNRLMTKLRQHHLTSHFVDPIVVGLLFRILGGQPLSLQISVVMHTHWTIVTLCFLINSGFTTKPYHTCDMA